MSNYKIKDFIGCFDGMVLAQDCNNIIEYFNAKEKMKQVFDRNKQEGSTPNFRQDKNLIVNVKEIADQTFVANNLNFNVIHFHEGIQKALQTYLQETSILEYLGLKEVHWGVYKLQKTLPGQGFHHWHIERGGFTSQDYYLERVLVFTVYLNDIEEGGETEFLLQNQRVKAKQGRVCIFPAHFPYVHRGNPPINQTKYICTGWFNQNP